MVDLYIDQILSGETTIDEVPEMWRDAVKLALEKDGES